MAMRKRRSRRPIRSVSVSVILISELGGSESDAVTVEGFRAIAGLLGWLGFGLGIHGEPDVERIC